MNKWYDIRAIRRHTQTIERSEHLGMANTPDTYLACVFVAFVELTTTWIILCLLIYLFIVWHSFTLRGYNLNLQFVK